MTEPSRRIVRLVGVYDADGTLRGEVTYWVGSRLGRRHCSLCDITHGSVRERPQWKACRIGLPVAFDTYHRDDQPPPISAVADGRAPVVAAETELGYELVLTPAEIDACRGSTAALFAAIEQSVSRLGLSWTTPHGSVSESE